MTMSDVEPSIRPSTSVREIETEDGAVLLDIQQGICLSLTPVAARIWSLLRLRRSPKQIAESLIAEYPDVNQEEVYLDVSEFIRKLDDSGLLNCRLVPNQHRSSTLRLFTLLQGNRAPGRVVSAEKSGPLRFLFWKALVGLMVFDLWRGSRSFHGVYEAVRAWPVANVSLGPESVERVCEAIRMATMWYPKRVLCLQRSAVTTCLLRACGVPAAMVIGARKFPFKAHAWTEVKGSPVNERRDVRQVYWIWERC